MEGLFQVEAGPLEWQVQGYLNRADSRSLTVVTQCGGGTPRRSQRASAAIRAGCGYFCRLQPARSPASEGPFVIRHAYWLRSHGIGYDTVGVGRGAGLSQPGKCTGYTPVCCGRGNRSPGPASPAAPLLLP